MDLSGNDKNKITGKKCQPVMSVTGLNDQGLRYCSVIENHINPETAVVYYTFN